MRKMNHSHTSAALARLDRLLDTLYATIDRADWPRADRLVEAVRRAEQRVGAAFAHDTAGINDPEVLRFPSPHLLRWIRDVAERRCEI